MCGLKCGRSKRLLARSSRAGSGGTMPPSRSQPHARRGCRRGARPCCCDDPWLERAPPTRCTPSAGSMRASDRNDAPPGTRAHLSFGKKSLLAHVSMHLTMSMNWPVQSPRPLAAIRSAHASYSICGDERSDACKSACGSVAPEKRAYGFQPSGRGGSRHGDDGGRAPSWAGRHSLVGGGREGPWCCATGGGGGGRHVHAPGAHCTRASSCTWPARSSSCR